MNTASTEISLATSLDKSHLKSHFIKLQAHEEFTGCNPFYHSSVIRQNYLFNNQPVAERKLSGKHFEEQFLNRFLDLKSFLPRNGLNKKFIVKLGSSEGVDFADALLEAVLVIEATTAFSRHELNTVRFAGIKSFDDNFDLIWASQTPSLAKEISSVAFLGLIELLPSSYYSSAHENKQGFLVSLDTLLNRARRRKMAASTAVVKFSATERGVPCELVGQQHLIVGQGAKQQHLYASMTSTTPITAQKICADKRQTNRRLSELRLPVPEHIRVGSATAARKAAKELGLPVIIKPVKGQKGRDISDKITSIKEISSAFESAHISGHDVLVEKYVEGDDYRLLVIDGKFHSALIRTPPTIVGDGVSTVSELIEQLNQDPYRDGFRGQPVTLDKEITERLTKAGVTPTDILEQGRVIVLRLRANVSTGGTPKDVTKRVHPEVRAMAERAAKSVKLIVAGIDYLTTDIERSPAETQGVIIEINARPGLDIHVWPHTGKSRDVGSDLIKHLFPDGNSGRIPIIISAGDRGTGTPARLVDALLRGGGNRVALTLKDESYTDGYEAQLSKKQQASAPLVMLRDPEIDSLISTVSLRQTAKRGMLLDSSDVTILIDQAKSGSVKAFLAGMEVVIKATNDCFVVSAGNLVALQRIEKLNKVAKLILVCSRRNDPSLQKHLSHGHVGVTTTWHDNDQNITILSGNHVIASFSLRSMSGQNTPRTKGVKEAILYAVGAAYGAGLTSDEISNGLKMLPLLLTRPGP